MQTFFFCIILGHVLLLGVLVHLLLYLCTAKS